MIEQLNAAHKSYIEELKKEHEEALDLKVKALEKSINNQALELKATQDDLAKAKSAVSSSAAEIESLKKQLAEADKAAATSRCRLRLNMLLRFSDLSVNYLLRVMSL